jgi:hypothetical protein
MNIHSVYRPFQKYFRKKRMLDLWFSFGLTRETWVLDVGGSEFNWRLLPLRPRVVLLNLYPPAVKDPDVLYVVGDGRYIPCKDKFFDLVYSNSVVEHVVGLEDQLLFARECNRSGKRYYVQTPNKGFLVEPHFITPFFHWLRPAVRIRLARNLTLWGLILRPSKERSTRFVGETQLLDEEGLRRLFPGAALRHERFLGMTKSLIAVSGSTDRPGPVG